MDFEKPLEHSSSTPPSAARRELADGRYILVRHVAEGGTAHVYLGYDTWTETWRAVKTLLPDYARRPALRHRFEREAATMKTLSHDNIIAVYDAGIEAETVFMVMEYAEGGSVIDWVERNGPMPPRMATNVVLELCRGIDAAHRQGVIHRDIKPQNLLVDRHGVCKVTDFGIAQVLEDTRMTMTGTVMGTMGYMAPEQNESAKHADERADVYSIAATFYTLAKGEAATHLFMADDQDFDGLPDRLVEIIQTGSQYKREQRYQTVREMMSELEGALRLLAPDPLDTPPLVPHDVPNIDELTPPSGAGSVGSGIGSQHALVHVPEPPSAPSMFSEPASEPASVYDEPPPPEPHREWVIGIDQPDEDVADPRSLDRSTTPQSDELLDRFERMELPEAPRRPQRPLSRSPNRNLEAVRIVALVVGTVAALGVMIMVIAATMAASDIRRHDNALAHEFGQVTQYASQQIPKDVLQTCRGFEPDLEGCDDLLETFRRLEQQATSRFSRQGQINRIVGIVREQTYPDCVARTGGQSAPRDGRCINMMRCTDDLTERLRVVEDLETYLEERRGLFDAQLAGCGGLVAL